MKQSTGFSSSNSADVRESRGALDLEVAHVFAARESLRGHVFATPCVPAAALSADAGCRVFLKREDQQATGSFKERGACNVFATLPDHARKTGVIAASAGNHALGLARHGASSGVPVTIVMPEGSSRVKARRCRELGATVVLRGRGFAEAASAAHEMAQADGLYFVHPFDDFAVMAGQGTIGLEMLDQVPELDVVVVPAGGGGLAAGVATAVKALKPSVRVVAVEPVAARSLTAAVECGNTVPVPVEPTLADGLAVAQVGAHCLEVIRERVDEVVAVTELEIAVAMYRLFEASRITVEGAGAAALAALLAGKVDMPFGGTVAVPLTGANVDAVTFARALQMAAASELTGPVAVTV